MVLSVQIGNCFLSRGPTILKLTMLVLDDQGPRMAAPHTCTYVHIQSGASSPAKHGDAYFLAIYGSIQDPIAAPGPYENQEP